MNTKFKKGNIPWNIGIQHSLETKEKMKQSKLGFVPWNKGLTKETDERVRNLGEKVSLASKNRPPKVIVHKFCKICGSLLGKKNKSGFCIHHVPHKLDNLSDKEKQDRLKRQMKNSFLKIQYGITIEEYYNILKEQNYRCCICDKLLIEHGKTQDKPHVDHDHKTKRVRGIICRKCNLILIYFDDEKYRKNILKHIGV